MSTEANLRHRLTKKLKISVGNSRHSTGGIKKSPRRLDDDTSLKRGNGGKLNSKRSKVDVSSNFDRRKKTSYADQVIHEGILLHENAKSLSRKNLSSKKQNQVKFDGSGGSISDKSVRSMWVSNRLRKATSEIKRSSHRITDALESVEVSDGKGRTKANKVNKIAGFDSASLKKDTRIKSNSDKTLNQSQSNCAEVQPSPSVMRKARDKRGFADDDKEDLDVQPKKSKRVIRIDPNDISNKRLDDGILMNEGLKDKKRDSEKNAEMSKNAQFRAIKPSPSIQSFVEDNLLGRRRLIELRRAGYNVELSAPLDNIPFSTSSERERIEENIFRNKLTFFAAAKVSSSFPPLDLPEIAFAGRSNVGKSSLLNSLTRQWGVVRTSDKPGLTQSINFFNLGSKLCLVDLPGYGFAYAKEEVKDAWEELVKEYVSTRVGLKRVCLLIDTKWGMKPRDHELVDLMERSQTKYQIMLTKTDMVFPMDVARRAMQIEETLKANKSAVQPVMMVSSKSGAGIQCLRTVLGKIARFAKL
ncbi:hypothetical protein HS088_TW02G00320 [Tripterygium wilfordii]|uniref:EngB-type G domain-containing protein n=1 Tax=Tripterygium wilfordii TaxID=458696 RepID=A0A7J7DY98_TRIWF|nr:uncharacterized protein LOC120005283 [Tripterygium wilfordii]KAF5751307.1 hypothetical protein HS088_TW02G00320 [Tripterygium wilfordii]